MASFASKLLSALSITPAAGLAFSLGCAPQPEPEPVQVEPRPILTAARDRQITMFGELPQMIRTPFATRSAPSLRQHSFAQEGADFDPDVDAQGKRVVFASTRHSHTPDLYVKHVDGVAVMQLTADPASDVQPAFSTDGKRVAFASDRAGNWDIWTIGTDGQHLVQVTDSEAHEVCPSWSPDGKSLVFSSLAPRGGQWEMWVTEAGTTGTKRFIGYGLFPEWSPVGDTIVYQRARERGGRWFSIWTVELIAGEPRYPTEIAASSDRALILPSWSSDGSQIAYCAVTAATDGPAGVPGVADNADIWVVSADGRGRRPLTDGHSTNFSPDWSAEGRIYFTRRLAGQENLWSVLPGRPAGPAAGPETTASAAGIPVKGKKVTEWGN